MSGFFSVSTCPAATAKGGASILGLAGLSLALLACGNAPSSKASHEDDKSNNSSESMGDDGSDESDEDSKGDGSPKDKKNKDKDDPSEDSGTAPTWYQDIAPILGPRCTGCHAEGAIGQFGLKDYEEAKALRTVIANSVKNRTMPPFMASETAECKPDLPWRDDNRLSDKQIQMVIDWAKAGGPKGDPNKAAKVDPPPNPELKKIDATLSIGRTIEVGGKKDLFKCITIDPGFKTDKYINSAQFIAGNPTVLHHAIAYIDETGQSAAKGEMYDCFGGPQISKPRILNAWAPGAVPMESPKGSGILIPAGSRIILNLHYHPTGAGTESDSETALALQFVEGIPKLKAEAIFIGNWETPLVLGTGLHPGPNDKLGPEFVIPPNVSGHTEHMQFTVPPTTPELRVWLAATHMHYVGKRARIWVERADKSRSCFLETPRWDFNWQQGYAYQGDFDDYPIVRGGDVLHIECEYDNTLDNPFVAEALSDMGKSAPVEVRLGEETLDEMCLGIVGFVAPNEKSRTTIQERFQKAWSAPGE